MSLRNGVIAEGTITAVQPGPPVSVSVVLGGHGSTISGVRCVDGYVPVVGHTIAVAVEADQVLAIGSTVGTSPSGAVFPMTSTGDETFQPDGVTNNALTLQNAASAVDGVTIQGSATGGAPSIAATGSDTNIPLNLITKGTGALQINGAAGTSTQVLTSNGPSAAPTWQTPAGGTPGMDLRETYMQLAAGLYESFPRWNISGAINPASGTLWLGAIVLPAGLTIGHITCLSLASTTVPTHYWFGLYDNNRVQLAVTADQNSTAWSGPAYKTLAIATIASGASTTFTTTYTGLHYVGLMMAANSPGSFMCYANGSQFPAGSAPALGGSSDTAQTTPPAFPHTAGALTTNAGSLLWAYVST